MAGLAVLFKRHFAALFVKRLHKTCVDQFGAGGWSAVHFNLRYKYDELSLKLRVSEGASNACADGVTTKLLQVNVEWHCLFRAKDTFIRLVLTLPTTLRRIDRTTATCMKHSLQAQTAVPAEIKSLFGSSCHTSIADSHASNNLADMSLWADLPDMVLSTWICQIHKENSVGEHLSDACSQDTRGLS